MSALGNDRWRGSVRCSRRLGRYRYTVVAWVDHFLSWRHDFARRIDAEDLRIAALVGADLIDAAAARAHGDDRQRLRAWAKQLRAAAGFSEVARRWRLTTLSARWRPAIPTVATRPSALPSFRWSSIGHAPASRRGTSSSRAPAGPMSTRTAPSQTCDARLEYVGANGLRRGVPAADPSDRTRAPQGQEQHAECQA